MNDEPYFYHPLENIEDIDEFEAAVAGGVVLADFWAPWSSSCKMLGSILEQAAKDMPENATIVKIDVDDAQALAGKLGVQTLPQILAAVFIGDPRIAFKLIISQL